MKYNQLLIEYKTKVTSQLAWAVQTHWRVEKLGGHSEEQR